MVCLSTTESGVEKTRTHSATFFPMETETSAYPRGEVTLAFNTNPGFKAGEVYIVSIERG